MTADQVTAAPETRLFSGEGPDVLCTVCGSKVIAKGLRTCHRHVIHELGITYRQLNHWVILGHLKPEQEARQPGMPRRWPSAEREVARRMARLTAAGIAVETAAAFARESWPSGEIAPGVRVEVRDAG